MQNNSFTSETSNLNQAQAYRFSTRTSAEVYNEIMNIAREIERCRASV